jgi:hypothetical protein
MNQTRSLPLPTTARDEAVAAQRVPTRSERASERTAGGRAALPAAAVLLVVAAGRLYRDEIPIRPDAGLGYALGIAGGATMLLLTLYVARKKLRFMRRWGKLSHWFRVHMILGVVAPLLILFHCNFRLGAPNSNVALASMLLVAISGTVGRFLYTRINHGLYGARATLEELHAQLDLNAHTLGERLPQNSRASRRLVELTEWAREPRPGALRRLRRFATLPLAARRVHRRVLVDLRAELDAEAARGGWTATARAAHAAAIEPLIAAYLAALVQEKQFHTYERLASLWHAVHIPLFVMLLLSGILHVIAVHMY